MSTRPSEESNEQSLVVTNEDQLDGKQGRATAFEPGWRAAATGGAILLSLCLIGNVATLIWAVARPSVSGSPNVDGNIVLVDGDCGKVNSIKTWSHLAINIVSTLILSTSTVCMQCLSAPTRAEVDEAHRVGKWLDVGILSTRNLRNIPAIRIFLYTLLGVTSIPLHLLYNSVIFTTAGTYDSLTLLVTNEFLSSGSTNQTHIDWLHDSLGIYTNTIRKSNAQDLALSSWNVSALPSYYYTRRLRSSNLHGAYVGLDPWHGAIEVPDGMPPVDQIQTVIRRLSPTNGGSGLVHASSAKECIGNFSSSPLTKVHNVVLITSLSSNINGSVIDLDFGLAPGRAHWSCNQDNWMYNSSTLFFSTCYLQHPENYLNRNLIASPITEPIPDGYWTVDECYYETVPERCTLVFAKWLMFAVVVSNILKLAAMIYTVKVLDFQPCITVGDMVGSFLRRPDIHTVGITPHSNLSIRESYRYEISRVYSEEHPGLKDFIGPKAGRHEALMHQRSWEGKTQRWKSAASSRRWSVTMGFWGTAVITGAALVALQASLTTNWSQAWNQGLGQTSPDFVLPVVTPASTALLSQTIVANIPQIVISGIYVFYSGLLTTMLSAQELAGFATTAKGLRVSPPKAGQQRSSYFLQVPYRFALPILASMAALHYFVSQSIYLVRLNEYDILGNRKWPNFESVVGYSLQGTLAATILGAAMLALPVVLGFLKLPSGIPLVSHNTIAISIACHPFIDEPTEPDQMPLLYGRVVGTDKDGKERSRIGFSAGDVEPLQAGALYEDTRCLSTLLFREHGLDDKCTLDVDSRHLFVKMMKGDVKMA